MTLRGTSPSNEDIVTFRWEGPFSYTGILDGNQLTDESVDYGLYQVYGAHPLYGSDVLLYIGKAAEQTFGARLPQEAWAWNRDAQRVTVYVGRLLGDAPTDAAWSSLIDRAERLLIYSLAPACNSSGLNSLNAASDLGAPLRVFHVGKHRSIPTETSSLRWAINAESSSAAIATWLAPKA